MIPPVFHAPRLVPKFGRLNLTTRVCFVKRLYPLPSTASFPISSHRIVVPTDRTGSSRVWPRCSPCLLRTQVPPIRRVPGRECHNVVEDRVVVSHHNSLFEKWSNYWVCFWWKPAFFRRLNIPLIRQMGAFRETVAWDRGVMLSLTGASV